MKNAIKSEFRKLLTVRSTYILSGLAFLLLGIDAFYGSGFKGSYDEFFYSSAVLNTATVISFFTAISAVLLMAHEYRYNTIVYALTLSNSRSKVLGAKVIAVIIFAACVSIIAFCATIVLAGFGASVSGHQLPAQDFNVITYLSKSIFYTAGFALAGLLFTTILRNITASVAVLFIVPTIVEGLLGTLLKDNASYLPFRALQQVMTAQQTPPGFDSGVLSPLRSALVFSLYLLVAWLIAWWLFLRRDAN